MFAALEGTVEEAREACWRRLGELCEEDARRKQEVTELVRGADDRGDWRAAGFSSSAAWFAQAYRADHRTAVRITETSEALRRLPALDQALSTGELSLDQVAAAVEFATPETDAELARVAVGKPPGDIGRVARRLAPPPVEDDQTLYKRRGLSMAWTRGGRELAISGRLPLEHGLAFEQAIWTIAKTQRAADKRAGVVLDWQQSAADALVTLCRHGGGHGGVRRSPTTLIVHVSDDEPPFLEGAGPISPETAARLVCDARRLTIKPHGRDLVHSRVGRCASYAQLRALHKRSRHCQYPGCTAARELEAHHIVADECGGKTELANLILLCPRHHKLLHDRHIRTSGTGELPTFTDESGRAITTNQPHAPPAWPSAEWDQCRVAAASQ